MRKISQRAAHQAIRDLAQLRAVVRSTQARSAQDYPGGVHLGVEHMSTGLRHALKTARRLGHAVIAVAEDDRDHVKYFAVPHPGAPT